MIHKFLPAIGFDSHMSREEIKKLTKETKKLPFSQREIFLEEKFEFLECKKNVAPRMGIALYGVRNMEEQANLEQEYYLPYFQGDKTTSYADILVEKRPDRDSYIGICDDIRIEASLIFFVQNGFDWLDKESAKKYTEVNTRLILSGLANEGTILLPVQKSLEQQENKQEDDENRMVLVSAARAGDSSAIEHLTLEDIDTYSQISQRLMKEDVFSIVDSYFRPYGVECDQYSIMGEILQVASVVNEWTGNEVYILTLNVNGLQFDICVPKSGLRGEPEKGRRFKSNVWMQGYIELE